MLLKEKDELRQKINSLTLDMTNIQKHETTSDAILTQNQVLRRELQTQQLQNELVK